MAEEQLILIKGKGGVEDLLLGEGTVEQTRFGITVTITKINSSNIPYTNDASVESIKSKLDKKLEVPAGENINVVIGPNDSAGTGYRALMIPNS